MASFEEPTPKYPTSPLQVRLEALRDESFVLRHEQVLDQTLEECAYFRNHHPRNGYNWGRYRQHVARLPFMVLDMLYRRGINVLSGQQDDEFVRWLNSDEAKPWRTSLGEV